MVSLYGLEGLGFTVADLYKVRVHLAETTDSLTLTRHWLQESQQRKKSSQGGEQAAGLRRSGCPRPQDQNPPLRVAHPIQTCRSVDESKFHRSELSAKPTETPSLKERLVLVLLSLLSKYDWVGIWIRRRWNYLGHVLRFEPAHIMRAALPSLYTVR